MPFCQIQHEKSGPEYPIRISNFQVPISTLTKETKLKGWILTALRRLQGWGEFDKENLTQLLLQRNLRVPHLTLTRQSRQALMASISFKGCKRLARRILVLEKKSETMKILNLH